MGTDNDFVTHLNTTTQSPLFSLSFHLFFRLCFPVYCIRQWTCVVTPVCVWIQTAAFLIPKGCSMHGHINASFNTLHNWAVSLRFQTTVQLPVSWSWLPVATDNKLYPSRPIEEVTQTCDENVQRQTALCKSKVAVCENVTCKKDFECEVKTAHNSSKSHYIDATLCTERPQCAKSPGWV